MTGAQRQARFEATHRIAMSEIEREREERLKKTERLRAARDAALKAAEASGFHDVEPGT